MQPNKEELWEQPDSFTQCYHLEGTHVLLCYRKIGGSKNNWGELQGKQKHIIMKICWIILELFMRKHALEDNKWGPFP